MADCERVPISKEARWVCKGDTVAHDGYLFTKSLGDDSIEALEKVQVYERKLEEVKELDEGYPWRAFFLGTGVGVAFVAGGAIGFLILKR